MRPHAFLFNGDNEELRATLGDIVWQHFFNAILRHAPTSAFDIRSGAILLTEFTKRMVAVERRKVAGATSISHTLADDKDLRKTLALDFAESACTLWSWINVRDLTWVLLTHPVECIMVSDLAPAVREIIDLNLRKHLAYLGGFEIDCGNPVILRLTAGLLPAYYRFDRGVLQVIEPYGKDEVRPSWAAGLPFKAVEMSSETAAIIPQDELSARGRQSLRLILERGKPAHAENVLSALLGEWNRDRSATAEEAVRFGVPEKGLPVVDVRKLTEYALNEEHPDGKHKALMFRKLLDITKADWRFLAEQLVAGLQREIVKRPRKSEYGVQYHVDVPVVGRNGAKKLVRTAWKIPNDQPPFLTTVFIPERADTKLPAALEGKIIAERCGNDWRKVYDAADRAGAEAATNWIPTPMFVSIAGGVSAEYVESEGECGDAWVSLNGRSSFARWLQKHRLCTRGYPSGVWIFSKSPSQSVERASKYCEAFATVLRAHGVECAVKSRLT